MNNILRFFFIYTLLQVISPIDRLEAFSHQDSLIINNLPEKEPVRRFTPDPRKASMYSAVLPGMGQIYNRKYWKVPIVYGGFAAFTWYTMFANDEFVRYRNALDFRTDGNPSTIDEFAGDPRYTVDVLTRFKDYYRRERDRTIIFTVLFYGINIIDAAVDAHLLNFDVSEDLGMKIGPSLLRSGRNAAARPVEQMGLGIRLSVTF